MVKYVYKNTHYSAIIDLKELSKCLQRFYRPIDVLRDAIP